MTVRRLRAGVTVAVAAALIATGGCSSKSDSSSAPASSASPSSPSSSPTGTPDPNPCHQLKPATGPAAKKFGSEKVTAAECEMSLLTLEGSFLPKLMQATTYKAADFAPFRDYMTPVAQKAWDHDVAQISASGKKPPRSALNGVLALTYIGVGGRKYTLGNSTTAQPVSNRKLTSGRVRLVTVHGKPRVRVSLVIGFRFNLTERAGGRPISVDGQKAIAYTLAPNPRSGSNKPFLIDGWRGGSRFDSVKPATSGQ
jgi:hypothetical protein